MLEPLRKLDARGRLEWLWRSSIGVGLLFLLVAAVSRDFFFAVFAIGVIITGLADHVDHRHRRLWWSLVGEGIILVVGGIYLSTKIHQSSVSVSRHACHWSVSRHCEQQVPGRPLQAIGGLMADGLSLN